MKRIAVAVITAALVAATSPGAAVAARVDPVLVPPVADTDGPTPEQASALTVAWSRAGTELTGDPLYFAGAIYHGQRRGEEVGLVRRDAATGRRLPFAGPAVPGLEIATPVTDGSSVITITPGDGTVRAHRPDGHARWTVRLPGDQHAGWVLTTGGLVLAAAQFRCGRYEGDVCERTVLHALRADTGRRAWTRALTGGNPVVAAAGGRIAIRTGQDRDELHGDDIIEPGHEPAPIADDSPDLVTVLSEDNRRLWHRTVPGGGDLAAGAEAVYLVDDRLCAHRARDGRRLWCAPRTHRYHHPTPDGDRLYVATDDRAVPDDHRIAALDARTGRRLWTAEGAYPYGAVVVGNGVLWTQTNTDMPVTHLLAVRAADGAELRRLPLGGYSSGSVALGHQRVYLIRGGGALVSYR